MCGYVQGKAAEDEEDEDGDEDILDIPPSWVSRLVVARDSFKLKYPPAGQRCITYHKAKLELFAEHSHEQGTVTRLTLFKDKAQTVVGHSSPHPDNPTCQKMYTASFKVICNE